MAVTTQTYTLNPTWNVSGHADLVKSAFVDAGLMTDWYDSFLSGTIENRILEVEYDDTKTYGKTYYWFMFSGTTMQVSVASGWNAVTHVPTGTQYLDYFSTTTNATTNHYLWVTYSNTITLTITRYTSAIDTNFSWFLFRNGTTSTNLHIPHANHGSKIINWVDLDKQFFHHLLLCESFGGNLNSNYSVSVGFRQFCMLRRSYHPISTSLRGITDVSVYMTSNIMHYPVTRYMSPGNVSNSSFNYFGSNNYTSSTNNYHIPAVMLPVFFTNTNPLFTTNQVPIFTGLQWSSFLTIGMPSDFGITFHHGNNTMTLQDTFVVSSGTEEWEMINLSNNASAATGVPSPIFLARTVG
jgi:hypothetical protein